MIDTEHVPGKTSGEASIDCGPYLSDCHMQGLGDPLTVSTDITDTLQQTDMENRLFPRIIYLTIVRYGRSIVIHYSYLKLTESS